MNQSITRPSNQSAVDMSQPKEQLSFSSHLNRFRREILVGVAVSTVGVGVFAGQSARSNQEVKSDLLALDTPQTVLPESAEAKMTAAAPLAKASNASDFKFTPPETENRSIVAAKAKFAKDYEAWSQAKTLHDKDVAEHSAWKARTEKSKQIVIGPQIRNPRSGSHPGTIEAIPADHQIVGLHADTGKGVDRFTFYVQRPDGSRYQTTQANPGSKGGGDHCDIYLLPGENIDGYYLQSGKRTDFIRFHTNRGRWIKVGNSNGGDYKSKEVIMSGMKLVGLDFEHGRCVDMVRGFFRYDIPADQLVEPKVRALPPEPKLEDYFSPESLKTVGQVSLSTSNAELAGLCAPLGLLAVRRRRADNASSVSKTERQ